MGSGSVSSSSMAFSESGWSWFRGSSPRSGDFSPSSWEESPNWESAVERETRNWSSAVDRETPNWASAVVATHELESGVPPCFTAPQMMMSEMMMSENKFEAGNNTSSNAAAAATSTGMNIFSSSLPDLFRNKLGLLDVQPQATPPDVEQQQQQKLEAKSFGEEEEGNEIPLEQLELQAIGSLLPDDDELLAEASDIPGSSSTHDSEELDFFSNGGGLELDGDGFGAEEQTSRTIFVRNINSNVEDDELRSIFERFGDIRTLYTGCKHEGLVLISYYDIRGAKRAIRALQSKSLWGRKLSMHFLLPKEEPPFDVSQGIVAVFNVDPSVSNDDLREIFGVYGDIKEVHETPMRHRHRFIEYYDVRAAEAALRVLNRQDVLARRTPGPLFGEEFDPEVDPFMQPPYLPNTGFVGSIDLQQQQQQQAAAKLSPFSQQYLNSLAAAASGGLSSPQGPAVAPPPPDVGLAFQQQPASYPAAEHEFITHLRSLAALRPRDNLDDISRAASYDPRGLSVAAGGLRPGLVSPSSLPFLWNNPPQSSPLLWPSSAAAAHHLYGHAKLQSHLLNPVLAYPQVGCLPYGEKLRDRRRAALLRQSAPGYMAGLAGSLRLGSRSNPERKTDLSKGTLASMRFNSRHRNRRGDTNAADKEQFHLDLDRIISGEDKRTTLMLKNIPNKYTSKMLLAVIDEANQGTYDFIYLPIDFKNKCNVGYAFVNMIEPSYIISFYKAFNGKKWEKFNSEKVASVAYARIQGKAALVAHFQNSSLMNECRPIVFGEEGNTPDDPGKEIGIVMGSEEATKL